MLKELSAIADVLVERFFPFNDLVDLLLAQMNGLEPKAGSSREKLNEVHALVHKAIARRSASNDEWQRKLQLIFDGVYPDRAREFWDGKQLVHEGYKSSSGRGLSLATFSMERYEPREFPSIKNCQQLAPKLFHVVKSETKYGITEKIEASREVDRLRSKNHEALLESGLYEIKVHSRPIHGKRESDWESYSELSLPIKNLVGCPAAKEYEPDVLDLFLTDLRNTFAFATEGHLGNFLAYLLQPMLCHYQPGEFPAYSFQGPPGSGKTFMARGVPKRLYRRAGASTVVSSRLQSGDYELQVFLSRCHDAVYIVFEEVKDAAISQLSMLNDLFTASEANTRVLNRGFAELSNSFVYALTAVKRGFYDETQRRLVHVTLTDPRGDEVKKFNRSWRERFPVLLKAMHEKLQGLDALHAESDPNEPRGPGFAIMAHAVKLVFGVDVEFTLQASEHEIYDEIIEMHELAPKGCIGRQAYYSLQAFMEYLRQHRQYRKSKTDLREELETAFSQSSTKNIPCYKEKGYVAESGRRYHLGFTQHADRYKISVEDLFWARGSGEIEVHEADFEPSKPVAFPKDASATVPFEEEISTVSTDSTVFGNDENSEQ